MEPDVSTTTAVTRHPDREHVRLRSIRENMKRDDWRPRYGRPGTTEVAVENIVFPDGQPASLSRSAVGRPYFIVGREHLGTFSLRDHAARVARGEALRAWEAAA